MGQFIGRMIRAAKLDSGLYEEVQADAQAMRQAQGVVFLASLAAGIGSYTHGGLAGLIVQALAALLGWYIWASSIYWLGVKVLPGPQTQTSHDALFRTLGFACTPGLLRLLGVVPGLTGMAFLVAAIWMLITTVIAVRQALDYTSLARTIGVCMLGWLVQVVILLPLFILSGQGPAP